MSQPRRCEWEREDQKVKRQAQRGGQQKVPRACRPTVWGELADSSHWLLPRERPGTLEGEIFGGEKWSKRNSPPSRGGVAGTFTLPLRLKCRGHHLPLEGVQRNRAGSGRFPGSRQPRTRLPRDLWPPVTSHAEVDRRSQWRGPRRLSTAFPFPIRFGIGTQTRGVNREYKEGVQPCQLCEP